MEGKTRLGRGLEEVSQQYLSGDRLYKPGERGRQIRPHPGVSVIRICHPGSSLMQSSLCANLALELVKNRFEVFVWDMLSDTGAALEILMRSLAPCRNGTGETRVSMYGLPDIVILRPQDMGGCPADVLGNMIVPQGDESCLLVNSPAPPVSVVDDGLDAGSILVSTPDEKSLLRCYAYMKILMQAGQAQAISVVLDDPADRDHAHSLFRRFAAFMENRLGVVPDYLGSLCHDECLDLSIKQARPLMLLHEDSRAKEDMALISANIVRNRQLRSGRLT